MKKIFFTIALIALALNTSAQVTDGLVAKYSFNGNANDEAGNHHGNVFGATLTTDRFGNSNAAYHFNLDSSQYIEIPYSADFTPGTDPMSISVWFLCPPRLSSQRTIIDWYRCGANPFCVGSDNAYYIIEFLDSSRVYFAVRDDNGFDLPYTTTQGYNDSSWHHAMLVFDPVNNYQKYYLDNILLDSVTVNISSLSDGGIQIPLEIGRRFRTGWDVPVNYFTGKIDDISIYKKALTIAQVDSLFSEDGFGISNNERDFSFFIFPNPVNHKLHIQNNSTQSFQFTLYNCLGERIVNKVFSSKTISIDLSAFANNIYFYKLISNNNFIKTGKIIKQ